STAPSILPDGLAGEAVTSAYATSLLQQLARRRNPAVARLLEERRRALRVLRDADAVTVQHPQTKAADGHLVGARLAELRGRGGGVLSHPVPAEVGPAQVHATG